MAPVQVGGPGGAGRAGGVERAWGRVRGQEPRGHFLHDELVLGSVGQCPGGSAVGGCDAITGRSGRRWLDGSCGVARGRWPTPVRPMRTHTAPLVWPGRSQSQAAVLMPSRVFQ